MQKLAKAIIILLVILSTNTLPAKAATTVSVNDLIEHAKELDGQKLTIQGEAIGEALERGEYSWININDGTNAIGVWVSRSDAEKVTSYGNYKNSGDIIQTTGMFHRACKEHGGEADFHADTITVIKRGHPVKEELPISKRIGIGVLTCVTAVIVLLYIISGQNKMDKPTRRKVEDKQRKLEKSMK
ncbi:MAG: hypothetical protein H6Q59_776 [Firmicutes bacterium]|nr:hypothetical protein [Bacillota bacterium]